MDMDDDGGAAPMEDAALQLACLGPAHRPGIELHSVGLSSDGGDFRVALSSTLYRFNMVQDASSLFLLQKVSRSLVQRTA